MKELYTFALGILATPVLAGVPIINWKLSSPVAINTPLMLDSTDVRGKKFDKNLLLTSLRQGQCSENAVAPADSSGFIMLPKATDGFTLQVLQSRLCANRFAKGKLEIKSQQPLMLSIDGKKTLTHHGTEQTSSKVPLTLAPGRTYNLSMTILSDASDTVSPSVKVEWIPDNDFKEVSVHVDLDKKRRFTLDDTMFGPRVSEVKLSADGQWLLTYYSNMTEIDRVLRHTTLTDMRTGKSRQITAAGKLQWMPSSPRLFYTERGENGLDLVILDPVNMSVNTVAHDVPDENMMWNRTEDRLYYLKEESPESQQGPLKRLTSPAERVPGVEKRYNLHEYDPATGLDRTLTYGRSRLDIADLHPDGRHLLIMTACETPTRRPFDEFTLMELDTHTLSLDTIVSPTGFLSNAIYSPDASRIAIIGSPDCFGGIGKNYGSHAMGNDCDHQLFILDRTTGSIQAVSKDFDPSIDGAPTWSGVDNNIYFTVVEGFDQPLYSFDTRRNTFTRIKLPEGESVVRGVSMSSKSSRIAFLAQGAATGGGAFAYDIKSRKTSVIDDPLKERLSEIEMAQGTPWQFTASDGTSIDGYMFLPPDFDKTRKYPLIVYYYGGTLPSQHGITSPYSPQVFASRDYVVYVLNPSGTVGYGQEFSARHCNAWGKRTAQDIIEGTEQFVKAHPFINPDKIGCIGASYGGFMTQYLQTLTPMFAAAVSHAGISDVTSYWGEGYWGYSYNSIAAPDSYPWNNPDLFTKQGSLFNADKINTPLLLLHGTADTNVPIGESIQIYNALKILGKTVELVTVDGENHFITDYAKRRQWQDTIMAWFARYLQDDPSWWESMYPAK